MSLAPLIVDKVSLKNLLVGLTGFILLSLPALVSPAGGSESLADSCSEPAVGAAHATGKKRPRELPPLTKRDEVPPRDKGPDTYFSMSTRDLWENVVKSDRQAIIGLKVQGDARGMWQGHWLISRGNFSEKVNEVKATIGVKNIAYVDKHLPFVVAILSDEQALSELRSKQYVDYIEPGHYEFVPAAGVDYEGILGCAVEPVDWPSEKLDDGDILPRTFRSIGIVNAWDRKATGRGANLGLIDTGLFKTQDEFFPKNFGSNAPRILQYEGCKDRSCLNRLDPNRFDTCNHGTRMAGVLTAPKNGTSVVGVAFEANLYAGKAANGVWADTSTNHLLTLREIVEQGAQIVVMAFGQLWTSDSFGDEIDRHYYQKEKNLLFVAAAGTAPVGRMCSMAGGNAFPARKEEVLSVTGVNERGEPCDICCGRKNVDIAAFVQRTETSGSGTDLISIDGSSNATAIVSGIAALVWSQNLKWTRYEVWNRIRKTARFVVDEKHWVVDANRATGLQGVRIEKVWQGKSRYRLTAVHEGFGNVSYRWNLGEKSRVVKRTSPATVSVVVTDAIDNTQCTTEIRIEK